MRTDDFAFGLAGGFTTVVAAALVTAAILPAGERFARLVAMAVVTAMLAVVIADGRAAAGVTVAAALVFVGFLAHRFGVLTGDPHAWLSTPVIVLAAALGRVIRAARVKNASRRARPV
jgi:hypothetical protein